VDVMARKIFPLVCAIGLTIWVAQVQSQLLTGTPTESPSPPKHRTEATPPVESAESRSAVQSPAASPTPRLIRRKTMTKVPPSPIPTPVASPTPRKFQFRFPRLFKPRGRRPPVQPARIKFLQVEVALRQEPTLQPADVMGALGRQSRIGQRGFARATAAWPPTPADGPRRDRFFPRVLACRRSLAGTQPGTLTQ
jgi:hypothetical protein